MMGGVAMDRDGQATNEVEAVGFVCLTVLCVSMGCALVLRTWATSASRPLVTVEDTINPNDAPPASLSRLPSVGPSRAREIVSYRSMRGGQADQGRVFSRADDLEKVPGIGPVTVETIRPWLSFDSGPVDREEPVGRRH